MEKQRTDALWMAILCWNISGRTIFPQQYQITATLAILDGCDSVIDKGGTRSDPVTDLTEMR